MGYKLYTKARVYQGPCGICYLPILAGDAYVEGPSRRSNRIGGHSLARHYNCVKPQVALTWQELEAKGRNG